MRGRVEGRACTCEAPASTCFLSCSTTSRADSYDLLAIAAPRLRDLGKDGTESRMAPAVFGREIGAAEKRLQLRREPDRHRPAAAAGGGLDERHVDAVHVGALFAVHLDGHVIAIHQRGDLFVLEALALHDVAPVAGGVADGKEDGLVLQARFLEGRLAPGIPIHGIVGVLQQIGTLLLGQAVGVQWKEPLVSSYQQRHDQIQNSQVLKRCWCSIMSTRLPRNFTPSISRRMRCSIPASNLSLISPPAPTTRCHGSPSCVRRSNCAT